MSKPQRAPAASAGHSPLESLDQWEDDLKRRYPQPLPEGQLPTKKDRSQFRNYGEGVRPAVREFYRLNHTQQTVDFVRRKHEEFLPLNRRRMGAWEAIEYLNTLVDDSDPDTQLTQIEHILQTAEAIRRDGHPRWFVLTGLLHDLGKILCLFGEPQWAVVGDTFPVGCAWSESIVLAEHFGENPDRQRPEFQTACGIYSPGCGLDNVLMSWGHDEYLYHVVKEYLPPEALYMIRYHSFYPAHREGAYDHLMNDQDRRYFSWVRKFNPYDLYTKSDSAPDVAALRPYYDELIAEFLPPVLNW